MAWRAALRDLRAGELTLLILSLVVAVAAVTGVSFLADRVGKALARDAAQMLGGDLVLEADAAPAPELLQQAQRLGLETTRTWQFPSMVGNEQSMQLAAVKVVQGNYPLRGQLRIAPDAVDPGRPVQGAPEPGTVWIDPQLLGMLGMAVGQDLAVGDTFLRIAGVIRYEPDRGMQFVNVAPRVLMRAEDLPATGLDGPYSRIGHALLLAGEASAVQAYQQWLAPRMQRGQRLATLESGRPEVGRTLGRAQHFLSLVALLAVMVSAVAVALAARRYTLRHRDGVAVMRCLGAGQGLLMRMLGLEFFFVAALAAAAGSALGYAVHTVLVAALAGMIDTALPAPGWQPAAQGLLVGCWLLLGFALPPVAELCRVPPARALRRESAVLAPRAWLGWVLGLAGFAGLVLWFAGDVRLAAVVAGGFLAAFGVFGLVAWLVLRTADWARRGLRGQPALRFALAGMARRKGASAAQICALGLGLMALLLLAITRTDLIAGWRQTLPPDAPNRFVINIQPEQREAVRQRLAQAGTQVELSPMIRGRLLSINERAVSPDSYEEPRAKRMVDREFNLSYADRVPSYSPIVAGRELDPQAAEVSMETGIAQTLGIGLGDTLSFDVAGQTVAVTVTSLREVDWDSMRVNFFALMSPAALAQAPQSWITSFHLPADQAPAMQALVRDYPNLTVFDVGAILAQLQGVIDQVVAAVQWLFLFTLAAGILVLAAALSSTRDERTREAALMRALGATRAQLAQAQRLELLGLGALAGLLAAAGATAVSAALAHHVFNFALALHGWPWLAGAGAGALAAWAGGSLALRGVLRAPPLVTLREA
ncbi:FtsX-like permease family protein [Orrella sp. JC864]